MFLDWSMEHSSRGHSPVCHSLSIRRRRVVGLGGMELSRSPAQSPLSKPSRFPPPPPKSIGTIKIIRICYRAVLIQDEHDEDYGMRHKEWVRANQGRKRGGARFHSLHPALTLQAIVGVSACAVNGHTDCIRCPRIADSLRVRSAPPAGLGLHF